MTKSRLLDILETQNLALGTLTMTERS
jgi:hypothetical protein